MKRKNVNRAVRAAQPFKVYTRAHPDADDIDLQHLMSDFIADLMHYSELMGLDGKQAVTTGRDHYEAER